MCKTHRYTTLFIGVAMLVGVVHAHAETTNNMVMFGFEKDLQEWEIPAWAVENEDYVGSELALSSYYASEGVYSLEALASFPGGRWTGVYVERLMNVTDWGDYGTVSVDVYLPQVAPAGLKARFILTVGEEWTWTEMNHAVSLVPGEWTTIMANAKPGSSDWKFFPTDSFRHDVRKLGVRVESDRAPAYTGPIYIDNIQLSD